MKTKIKRVIKYIVFFAGVALLLVSGINQVSAKVTDDAMAGICGVIMDNYRSNQARDNHKTADRGKL